MSIYYSDESVTLYHGDCREITAWLEADVLVTDPPYGVSYSNRRGATVANDHDFTMAKYSLHLWPGTGPMAVFASHASLRRTIEVVDAKFNRMRVVTWHKTNVNGSGMGVQWLGDVEFVVCGVPEWPKMGKSAVISARKFTGNPAWHSDPEAYLHPTQKPTPLMQSVLSLMPPGTVADPFAGSGSTLVAAKQLGRKAIGVELEERYCEIIAKRLAQGVLDFGSSA
jgi:site-specific DNA-methyltransferase (adenine-specific)